MNRELAKKIIETAKMTSNENTIKLRRAIGTDYGEKAQVLLAYRQVVPYDLNQTDDFIVFSVITMLAYCNNISGNITFASALKKYDENWSEREMSKIFDNEPSEDSTMLYAISNNVKRMFKDGIYIDFVELLYDLANWNHDSDFVRKKWAKDFVQVEDVYKYKEAK